MSSATATPKSLRTSTKPFCGSKRNEADGHYRHNREELGDALRKYENIEELNCRVLMSLVDRILIYENHVIEIVFKYKDEYQQTLEYVLSYSNQLAFAV